MDSPVAVHWHFTEGEIDDLPSHLTLARALSDAVALSIHQGDVVTFSNAPGAAFAVAYRRFEIAPDPQEPIQLHVHLARLDGPLPWPLKS